MIMSQKNIKIAWVVFLIIGTIGIVVYTLWAKNNLKKNHLITVATIHTCQNGSRGNAGRFFLNFTITLNGKEYSSSNSYLDNELSFFAAEKYFVGKTFPAVYYPSKPSLSSLLVTPKNFAHFGYSFPDSLNWILQYIPQ